MTTRLEKYDKEHYYFNTKKDFYFYKTMLKQLELDEDIKLWDSGKVNFILIMLILQNKIFNHGDFSELYLKNFLMMTGTRFYKIYDIYQSSVTSMGGIGDINFRDKLLEYNTALELNQVKDSFFSLSFNKKYYLVENFEGLIKSILFLCCFAQFIKLDGNFFYSGLLKDKSTTGVLEIGTSSAIETLFLKKLLF